MQDPTFSNKNSPRSVPVFVGWGFFLWGFPFWSQSFRFRETPEPRNENTRVSEVLDDDDDKIFEPTELHTFESVGLLRSCAMSLKHSLCLGVVFGDLFFFKRLLYTMIWGILYFWFLSKHLNCVFVFCLRILSWYITMGRHHLGNVFLFISTSEQANPSCVFLLDSKWK